LPGNASGVKTPTSLTAFAQTHHGSLASTSA